MRSKLSDSSDRPEPTGIICFYSGAPVRLILDNGGACLCPACGRAYRAVYCEHRRACYPNHVTWGSAIPWTTCSCGAR